MNRLKVDSASTVSRGRHIRPNMISERSGYLGTDGIEHEQPDSGGQVAFPACIDVAYNLRNGQVLAACNVLEPQPERIFEADAGLMSVQVDGSLDDW